MKRFHARVAVVKALQDAGLYIEQKDNPMQIPVCSKSGDIIEPILKPQWWVNCQPLAEDALKVSLHGVMPHFYLSRNILYSALVPAS